MVLSPKLENLVPRPGSEFRNLGRSETTSEMMFGFFRDRLLENFGISKTKSFGDDLGDDF